MAAHRQPAYADHPHVDLPVTERLTDNTLILPLFHTMTEDEQARRRRRHPPGRRCGGSRLVSSPRAPEPQPRA